MGLGEEGAEDSDESRVRAGLVLREPAQPPTSGDVRSPWLSFAWAARRGLRGGPLGLATASGGDSGVRSRPPGQLCRFLPLPQQRSALRAKFPFVFYYRVDVWVSANPAKLSWLRRLPTDVPHKTLQPGPPRRPSHCPLPGQQGADGVEPQGCPPPPPLLSPC